MNRATVTRQRPAHGCARCIWFKKNQRDNWGKCMLTRNKRWWQAPPCQEYELDPDLGDIIELADGEV